MSGALDFMAFSFGVGKNRIVGAFLIRSVYIPASECAYMVAHSCAAFGDNQVIVSASEVDVGGLRGVASAAFSNRTEFLKHLSGAGVYEGAEDSSGLGVRVCLAVGGVEATTVFSEEEGWVYSRFPYKRRSGPRTVDAFRRYNEIEFQIFVGSNYIETTVMVPDCSCIQTQTIRAFVQIQSLRSLEDAVAVVPVDQIRAFPDGHSREILES